MPVAIKLETYVRAALVGRQRAATGAAPAVQYQFVTDITRRLRRLRPVPSERKVPLAAFGKHH